jgi:hypothetical protein
VQASVGAFVALGTAMAAGLILAAGALVSLPPLLVACAAVVMAVVGMTAEAWRVSRRTGRNWWRSLGLSLKAGARFLFQLL